MDGQVYWKGGSNKTTSTSTSTPYQQNEQRNLLDRATEGLNNGFYDQNYGGSADFNANAGMTAGQTAGLAGLSQTGQDLQSLLNSSGMSSLSRYLGAYDPNNTGLTGAIDAANNQLDWNYQTTVAPQIRQGATDAGQYGSTRHGVAEGIANAQLSQQKTNAASQLAFQDQQAYNQNQLNALNNLTGIAKGLASGSSMQYDAGTLEQQQNQNQINADLQKWAYENNVDVNDLLTYQQLISGDMGGKNVTTTKGGSGGGGGLGSALGSIGGAALGGYFGGTGGASVGSSVGGSTGGLLF